MLALVYICTKECTVSQNHPSYTWINPSILFVCYFSPTPLIVFLVAMKKCAIPLSEPLDDHRPKSEMVWRRWCNGGPRGYCHRRTDTRRGENVQLFAITTMSLKYILKKMHKRQQIYKISGRNKVKLKTLVEGDPKAHFWIATSPRCRRGRYSIPWIAPLYP